MREELQVPQEDDLDFQLSARGDMSALVIGQAVLAYFRDAGVLKDIYAAVDSRTVRIVEEIQRTLDDDTLDDPECFQRIEKILRVLESNWMYSSRHDW